MKLGIDVDDVLASFISRFRIEAKQLFPRRLGLDQDPTDWEWTNWGLTPTELGVVWKTVAEIPNFHIGLETMSNTDRLADLFIAGHDVYFISARFATGGFSAKYQTEWWLETNYGIRNPTVLIAKNKAPLIQALELDAFIDDNGKTCVTAAAETTAKVTMMTRLHNQSLEFADRVTTFNEWAERFL